MIIGTVRIEEAAVRDSKAGYHNFHSEEGDKYGSFEVFFRSGEAHIGEEEEEVPAGWYWWACFPGCMPDGEEMGPFASSAQAFYDADEWHPDNGEE